MNSSRTPQVGDKVLILCPAYVAGNVGVVRGEEILSDGKSSGNWIVEVTSQDLVVSLAENEFQIINKEQ
ncbi:hypothetical protein NIES4071_92660 [Calothrix sp. NIES-4071]|nr:hypothetical protein NIES4071_92660 [Calothrix sp. NIES-4071]BAZ63533.1 hypothetical protein NIES4105_92590 [Calothrix sp. NIES-4105]